MDLAEAATFGDKSDEHLLQLGREGDEEAFLVLYRRHQPAVFRFALHMSGSRPMAEEVVQEVFLSVLQKGSGFRAERGALEAFLVGTARNLVRRQLQRARREDAVDSKGDLIDHRRLTAEAPTDEPDLEVLRAAILALPPHYREIVVLCELEELSYADVAERLGCAVGTVRSRLHRARVLLEGKLRRRERCHIPAGR